MPKCRSCNAEIVWCRTPKGGQMPVDAQPDPDGNLVMDAGQGATPECRPLKNSEKADHPGPFHKSHFATCPNAKDHRKTRND